jgi:type I restriction enzyme S subunit
VKAGWEVKTLDQISQNLDHRREPISKSVRVSGDYPYYGASGIVDYVSEYLFDEDTLLVSEDGANLLARSSPIAFSASGKYWVNNHAHVLRFRDRETQRFVEHFFASIAIDNYVTGAAQPKLTQKALNSIPIPVPGLGEQKRIVGILDEAFEGIARAKANAERNLQNARALFESYLESVLTQRGEGWKEVSLGELASFRNGINFTQDSKGEEVKIVGVKDFRDDYWIPSENLDVVTVDGKLSELDVLKKGDILTVRSNGNPALIGRCILAGEVQEKISHSGFTIRLRLSGSELLPQYLCHFMKCTSTRKQLTDAGTGTNIKSLNQQTLSALTVLFPSVPEQRGLVARIEELSEEVRELENILQQKLAAVDELKRSLLHQAFTGALYANA